MSLIISGYVSNDEISQRSYRELCGGSWVRKFKYCQFHDHDNKCM